MSDLLIIVRPVGGYGLFEAQAISDAGIVWAGGLSEADALRRLQIKLNERESE